MQLSCHRIGFEGIARTLALLAVALTPVPLIAQTFDEGRSAYLRRAYDEAFALWADLAERGDPRAQFGLGTLYHEGSGAARDGARAAKWFRRAAEQGYAPAQFNLGNAYRRGDGVQRSDELANQWWDKAARQGFAPAQFNLAGQYYFGRGTSANQEVALDYYRQAAANGHVKAAEAVRRLEGAVRLAEPRVERGSSANQAQSDTQVGGSSSNASGQRKFADNWMADADPRHFTLQLASLGSRARAEAYVARFQWRGPVDVVEVLVRGKTLYTVVYGVFSNKGAAMNAMSDIPRGAGEPWIREILSLIRARAR